MIDAKRIAEVAAIVAAAGLNDATLARLRADFADLHFTYCSDDDVGEREPAHAIPGCNIYLIDGTGHCLAFTNDPEAATGLVLAAVDDAAW
jgi:hypothetical protein